MEKTFTIEEAIQYQTEHLAQWKKVLIHKVYLELVAYATETNETVKFPSQIRRGNNLTVWVENHAIKLMSETIEPIEDKTEKVSSYNKEHQDRLNAETRLPNCEFKVFEEIDLGETTINISGKECNVSVTRNSKGHIEIEPIDEGIEAKGGWLEEGFSTEGYNYEVNIYQFNP